MLQILRLVLPLVVIQVMHNLTQVILVMDKLKFVMMAVMVVLCHLMFILELILSV